MLEVIEFKRIIMLDDIFKKMFILVKYVIVCFEFNSGLKI